MKPLCIYHGGCDDGFAAAYVVKQFLGDEVEFYPGIYQQDPPNVTSRDVLLVDFSYKLPVLTAMATSARSVLVLDHHKTAQEDMAGLPTASSWREHLREGYSPSNLRAVFDMGRSGAGLAWDFFISAPRPEFINYIEDRDLWRKQLPFCDEFTIALRSYPQTFEAWDALFMPPLGETNLGTGVRTLIREGKTIQRYYRARVEELKGAAYMAVLGGDHCWIANAPYFAASEVADELADRGLTFGACYFELSDGRYAYSLRSRCAFDVSDIARKFGGGGHKKAAGFSSDKPVHSRTILKSARPTSP